MAHVIIFNIMGQITIEIPQNISRTFRIQASDDSIKQILSELEKLAGSENSSMTNEPDEVLGIWADREESADEIARKLRRSWDRTAKND